MPARRRHGCALSKNCARLKAPFLIEPHGVQDTVPIREAATLVAVFNNDDDTVQRLSMVLESDGYLAVSGKSNELRRDRAAMRRFLTTYNPRVILYGIAIPYEANWQFMQWMQGLAEFAGRQLVVTTTNKSALDRLVGRNDAIEIIGKPYDLSMVLHAVRRAAGLETAQAPERRRGERRRA